MMKKYFCLLIAIITISFLILLLSAKTDCGSPDEAPQALIYPNSSMHNQGINSDPDYLYWVAGFTSPNSFEELVSFYSERSWCYAISEGMACTGDAEPYGTYIVYIGGADETTGETHFGVKVDWDACH